MAINVVCPTCRFAFRVSDDLAGRQVRCKDCRDPVPIPGNDRAVKSDQPSGRRRPTTLPVGVFVGLGVAVLLVAAFVIALVGFLECDPVANGPPTNQPVVVAVPRPAGMVRPVAQPVAADVIFTLSNPRRTGGAGGAGALRGRASYEVDYALNDGKKVNPFDAFNMYLVARTPTGRAEMRMAGVLVQNQGTISFREFIGRLTGAMDISIEREQGFGNRTRISNIVILPVG